MKKLLSIIFSVFLCCAFVFAAGCDRKGGGELTKSELSDLYIEIAKNSWQQLGAGDPTKDETTTLSVKTTGITLDDETTETDAQSGMYIKANGASSLALINMIGEFYDRDEFIVSDGFVGVTAVNPEDENDVAVISVLAEIDQKEDYVFIQLGMDAYGKETMYLIEINYDFDTDTLKSYRLIYYDGSTMNDQIIDAEGKTYMTTLSKVSDDYKSALDSTYSTFKTEKNAGKKCQGDFTEEYLRYQEYSYRAFLNVSGTQIA